MNSGTQKTKSERIRELQRQGLSVVEIAKNLDIRYQHVRNVLLANGTLPKSTRASASPPQFAKKNQKPNLIVAELLASGFKHASNWQLDAAGQIVLVSQLPQQVGVYAFAKDGLVTYVGVATMGLSKRVYFYARPGRTQLTSLRLNKIIKSELVAATIIEIYVAMPDDFKWNGLPVHGSAGLELGLIKKYALPWNKRGT